MDITNDFRLGYAMGILVGEGSFTGDISHPALQVKMHARDYAVLEFLKNQFGGKIYGPYTHGERYYGLWLLRGDELRQAIAILMRYLPDSYKREQFINWVDKYVSYLLAE